MKGEKVKGMMKEGNERVKMKQERLEEERSEGFVNNFCYFVLDSLLKGIVVNRIAFTY